MAVGILDFSVPSDISLTVNGLEFAPFVDSLSLRRPLPEINTPLAWTGSVTFVVPYPESQLPASLNDLVNPTLWAMGVHPVVLRVGGQTIARLRIMEYTFDDDPDPGSPYTGTAQLGDLLTLFDTDAPAKAWQELIETGGFPAFATPWNNVISSAFTAAGIANDLDNLNIEIPVAKDKPQGSVVRWAQQILGERGYWLYVDSGQEQVKAVRYPENIQPGDVLFTRPRSGVEKFKRRQSTVTPREKVVASGSTDVETVNPQSPGGPTTTYDYDDQGRLIGITTVETVTNMPTILTVRTTVQKALTAIDSYSAKWFAGNYAMVTTSIQTETKNTNAQGQVSSETTQIEMPLGVALPELVKDLVGADAAAAYTYFRTPITVGITTQTWTVRSGLVVTREKITTSLFRYGSTTYTGLPSYWELEEFTGVTVLGPGSPPPNSYKRTYRQWQRPAQDKRYKISGQYYVPAMNLKQMIQQEDQQPPAMDALRAEKNSNSIPLNGEATFQIAGTTPFVPKREDIQFQTLVSDQEAQQMARREGEKMFQSAYGRQFNLPMPTEWRNNPTPLQIAVVHDGMFVLTGDSLTWSADGLEMAWDANWLGAVPAVPEE